MKRALKTASLLLAVALVLCACQSAGGADDYKKQLMKKDTLVIGTSPDYAPYESWENGVLVGFDIEMMEAVVKSMDLTVEWSPMDFSNILVAVPAGQVDIGVSAFTYDEDRALSVLFNTVPYLKSAQVAFVKADSGIETTDDFAGKKFYAGLGTTGESALKEIEGVDITTSMDYQVAFELLNQGQFDGVVCDAAVGNGYIDVMGLKAIDPPLVDEENLVITRKGNEALVEALDKAFTEYMKTEEYAALRLKYGL